MTWKPQPTGGAFAALLGLAGTGLVGEYAAAGSDPAWRELRGPLSAFGPSRDAWNAPVTTVIPSIGLALSPEQQRFVTVRNGFAMRDADGEPLFGAQPFTVRWHGALLVEQPGEYRFEAGGHAAERECDHCDEQRWIVTLRRGQRTWSLLNHRWDADDAPAHCSDPLVLRRGVYEIDARLAEPESAFARDEHACPGHTGFEVRYCGPDSDDELVAIPFERLFRIAADEPLDSAITVGEAARRFLHDRYTSSLSGHPRRYADMRRLDDGLRGRARDALVAYLCGMGRVALPFAPGSFALQARDLGALLLQDVETGLCERASRIEDAISAAHAFVQRARLGLEPQLAVSPAFVALWDSHFATFGEWRCHKQRELYRENWIEWDELSSARDSEAFRFLEAKLREQKLTVAVPGGQDWWPSAKLPPAPCLDLLQVAEPSRLSLLNSPSEGLGLLGSLERAATPSWLAPVLRAPREDFPPRDAPLATSQASIVQQGGGSSGLQ